MYSRIRIAILLTVFAAIGCEARQSAPIPKTIATDSKSNATQNLDQPVDDAMDPKFPAVDIEITANNGSSCISQPEIRRIQKQSKISYVLNCGPATALTQLAWEYLGTTEEGDRYQCEYTTTSEQVQLNTKKQFIFAGDELLLFDTEVSTVRIRPRRNALSPNEPEAAK